MQSSFKYLVREFRRTSLCNFGAQTGNAIEIIDQIISKFLSGLCRHSQLVLLFGISELYVILDILAKQCWALSSQIRGLARTVQNKLLDKAMHTHCSLERIFSEPCLGTVGKKLHFGTVLTDFSFIGKYICDVFDCSMKNMMRSKLRSKAGHSMESH